MGFEAQTDIANGVAGGQLTEHHMKEEIVTSQIPHVIVPFIFCDNTVELISGDKISNLGQDVLTSTHNFAALDAANYLLISNQKIKERL